MKRLSSFLVVLLGVVLAACRPHGRSREPAGDDPQKWADALERHLKRHPDDVDARRDLAFVHWLHLDREADAVATFDALAKDGDVLARLSRMLVADARLDTQEVYEHAYALVEQAAGPTPADARTDAESSWALQAAAEIAARRIAALHGELDGDDARFVALFDRIAIDRLTTGARQALLSVRANIARTANEPYEGFYRQQGCVQSWEVGPVQGVRGELELARARTPFTPEPGADAVKLACVVRLWNPTVHAGVRRIRTGLKVPGDTLELELSAEEAMRVWLDGTLVLRTDRSDRFPRSRTVLRIPVTPGVHELELATVIPRDRAWVLVRATTPGGAEVEVVPGTKATGKTTGAPTRVQSSWTRARAPTGGKLHAPLRAMLALEDGVHDGDVDDAERWRDALVRYQAAEAQLAVAQFERFDPSRGRTVSLAREQAALAKALAREPATDAARLRQLELMLERGEEAEVLEVLQKLPKARLRTIRGELLRVRAYLARGDERRADEALARAAKLAPTNCRVLLAQRARARDQDDVAREDRITKELERCGGSLELRAQLAQRRGKLDAAEAAWREAIVRVPDDIDAMEALARLETTKGDVAAAKTELERVLGRNPLRGSALVMLADLAAHGDDVAGARKRLRDALAIYPHADALHQTAAAVGIPDELEQLRVDGLAAVKEYQRSGKSYPGVSEVLVLDRSAARVYANGGQRQIVHLVVQILSKASIDRHGELQFPEGARLLTLRTIKPDGTLLEAESVAGKEGLSLRDLAIGDFVEQEFVIEREPATALPGYVDVSTFRFQSLEIPYHRSELLVVHPTDMKVREDRRRDPPEAVLGDMTLGGEKLRSRLYRASNVERLGEEPGHRALLDELPNVRVYTDVSVPEYLDGLAVQIRHGGRSNVELRRLVRKLVGDERDPRARLLALWSWVVENVEDGGDLGASSTATLAARAGSRLMLLRTMLREAGVPAELWLARDRFGAAPLPGGHPMLEEYAAAMLAVELPGSDDPLMVLTASKVMPLGYLAPGYAGTDALRVHLDAGDGPSGPVKLPAARDALLDRRSWALTIDLDDEGAAKVAGKITLQGGEAIAWRQALREVDRDRIRELFQQAELGWLRGASLGELEILEEKQLDRPLVLTFTATAREYAIRQGDALILRADPLPLSIAARMTALPSRKTGMVVPFSPDLRVELTLRVHGSVLRELPEAVKIEGPFGRYERKLAGGGVGQDHAKLELRSTVRPGVVTVDDYARFSEFAREVESAEQALIRAAH